MVFLFGVKWRIIVQSTLSYRLMQYIRFLTWLRQLVGLVFILLLVCQLSNEQSTEEACILHNTDILH